jgi:hypothetical protein
MVMILCNKSPTHTGKLVRSTLETLRWGLLPHDIYSSDVAHSDYHLFASMGHALALALLTKIKKKWLDES